MIRSIDHAIQLSQTYGQYRRYHVTKLAAATTAATTTSGYVSAQRFPHPITVPSLGTGVTGMVVTYCRMMTSSGGASAICAAETTLGTLTVSGNSFAAGSAMPTRLVRDVSVTTASVMPVVYVSASATATTPTLTITYTDQDGNTGQTATLTLPSNALVNTCFLIQPHLANGDTGIRAVTNMSISAGSAGTLKVMGLLPIAMSSGGLVPMLTGPDPFAMPIPMIPLAAGDVIGFYRTGSALAGETRTMIVGTADL